MEKNAADFQSWVDRLVHACLPLELQMKLITLQPLTKAELMKYVQLVHLVVEAKSLVKQNDMAGNIDRILDKIGNLTEMSRDQLKNERSILWYVSSKDAKYNPKVKRGENAVRQVMLQYAHTLLEKDADLSERSAASIVIKRFAGIDGAYGPAEIESFRRQINRRNS